MYLMQLTLSLFELILMMFMSGVIIFVIYCVFIKANPDFDMEEEIKKGNVAVGTLVAAIMVSAALLLQKGVGASVGMVRMAVSAPAGTTLPVWQALLLTVGHLVLSLAVAVFSVSITLRLFGRMVRKIRPDLRMGEQLKLGNLAVGILLSAVVFIATFYIGEGLSALTKALVPQPVIGTIKIME